MRITFLSSRRELKSFSSEGTHRAENSCARSRSSSRESWGLCTVKTTVETGPSRKRHIPSSVLVFRFKWWELYLILGIHKSPMPGVCKSQMPGLQPNELCTEALNIFSAIIAVFSVHTKSICQSTRTKQKTSDKSDVHRPLQHCGSSVWKLLLVTLPAPTIWRKCPDFCKICVHLTCTEICSSLHHKIILCNQTVQEKDTELFQ